jgi:hypothetical protein
MSIGISSSSSDLLQDTLNLVHLARETAIARGKSEQAERLAPVVNDLKKAVTVAQEPPVNTSRSNIMAQNDFRALFDALGNSDQQSPSRTTNSSERNQVVVAMSAGGMGEIDIARQMGMSRDEVRTLVQIASQKNKTNPGGIG